MTQTPLLSVSGLSVRYGSNARALDDVTFDVERGSMVAVVGESGSGKSTTALSIIGLLGRSAHVESGSIRYDGTELTSLDDRALRRLRGNAIGFVPQDPTVSLDPTQRIGAQIAEVLEIHGRARRTEAAARAVEILRAVGLTEPERRARQYPHELSGGMRQRVLIGMAWACEPQLIIADEPTSALDVTVQRQVLDRLDTLRLDRGTAILLVTHDLAVAADRADHLVVMSEGRVVEQGPTDAVLGDPQHEYTKKLLSTVPSEKAAFALGSARSATNADPIVVAESLVKKFDAVDPAGGRTRVTAVDDVSFSIGRGRTFALVGESGSGKSTTARLITNLDSPTSGTVTFDGTDTGALGAGELRLLRRRFQLIQQNPYSSLSPRWSLAKIIEEPLRAFGVGSRTERAARSRELLDQVGLPSSFASRRAGELSGGQRQRVAIARALALRPDLIVCDEPISALDVSVQAQILDLLAELQRELEVSYLFISHDLSVVRLIADDVAVMQAGRIVEHGPVADVFDSPAHEYTAALIDAIPGRRTSTGTVHGSTFRG
ncbi:dipeptide ABC transporter ATP-binding protein [Rhodococcoides yunnanense]|uniref:dipeptide ABC transporter ATP-binding protein n=1 Tax=Rhodococcoides yunnanense TaxID=278209 RepID=UPI0009339718|nr:ABC transporter ATP-binding protein [Rhodococcus yunnanensis]